MLTLLLAIIIPVIGESTGHRAQHRARALVFNPTPRTAIVRKVDVYPLSLNSACRIPQEWSVPPRQTESIEINDSFCGPIGLTALSIASDEPVVVQNEVVSHFQDTTVTDVQLFEAPAQWIEAGMEAMTSATVQPARNLRGNLLVINPNDFVLVVQMHVQRRDAPGPSRDETFEVAPHSSRLHSIEYIPNPHPDYPLGFDWSHEITLAANGRFWAGASSIDENGGSYFYEAVALER